MIDKNLPSTVNAPNFLPLLLKRKPLEQQIYFQLFERFTDRC
jgi:hypothetical protein